MPFNTGRDGSENARPRRGRLAWRASAAVAALTLAAGVLTVTSAGEPPARAGSLRATSLLGVVPRTAPAVAPGATAPASAANRLQPRAADPTGDPLLTEEGPLVSQYLGDVAAASGAPGNGQPGNDYSVTTQYGPNGGSGGVYSQTFGGSFLDTDTYPADTPHGNVNGCVPGAQLSAGDPAYTWCLTDAQLQNELSAQIAAHGWPTNLTAIYVVMLPPGVDVCSVPGAENPATNPCADADFCAYHANFTNAQGAPAPPVYAILPWADVSGCQSGEAPNNTGSGGDDPGDDAVNLLTHEHNETITDPLGNAWWAQDCDPTTGACTQDESADKCIRISGSTQGSSGARYNQTINGHHYYLQDEFANSDPGGSGTFPSCEQRPGGQADGVDPNDGTPLSYHGGPVVGVHTTYVLMWDPTTTGTSPSSGFTASAADGHIGQPISLRATATTDPQGGQLSYNWAFGDGTEGSGASVSHTYAGAGQYPVTLTVSDSAGYSSSTTQIVPVVALPTASFTTPAKPQAGVAVAFNGSASTPGSGAITAWSWSFGDGSTEPGSRPKHTYSKRGSYTVTLTVTDSTGGTATKRVTLKVGPRPAPHLVSDGRLKTVRAKGHLEIRVGRAVECADGDVHCTVSVTATATTATASAHGKSRGKLGLGTTRQVAAAGRKLALLVHLNGAGASLLTHQRVPAALRIVIAVPGNAGIVKTLHVTLPPA